MAIAAGDFHGMALKVDGTVTNWGLNTSGQTNVPSGLSNVMAIAAGRAHSVALKNDGTVVCWGDNSIGQTNSGGGLTGIQLLAVGGDHTLASAFSTYVQYQVDVSKDLLLIHNSSSNSVFVKDYYLAHRPMANNANVLGIACTTNEIITPANFTNQILEPFLNWLAQNPTKRPQYVIAFLDIPSRVHEGPNVYDSVFYQLHTKTPGIRPFVTTINMGGTNECIAYINKVAAFGTNGQVIISASRGDYANTNYVVDNVFYGDTPLEANVTVLRGATNGLLVAGVESAAIAYLELVEYCTERETNIVNGVTNILCVARQIQPHLTNEVNVAGYISWGAHSSLGGFYPVDGKVKWTGASGWWIIETIESFNGVIQWPQQGHFTQWFSASAFGGTNYLNTPVGAVTHVDEPYLFGVNNAYTYLNLWAKGKSFGIAAWNSRQTERFQAVGDPFVVR